MKLPDKLDWFLYDVRQKYWWKSRFWDHGPLTDWHGTFLPKLFICKLMEHRIELVCHISGCDIMIARARCSRCGRFLGAVSKDFIC